MFCFGICRLILLVSFWISQTTCFQESNILYQAEDICRPLQTVRQHLFVKEEFRFLNVTTVGWSTVYDAFDCNFECLTNPSCVSVNLAASKGADGKLWCELLSSDKYRNSKEYKENQTFHHFSIKSPCSSSPCLNGGTCVAKYRDDTFCCLCRKNFTGAFCQVVVGSCKEAYDIYGIHVNPMVMLNFTLKPVSVYCHMGDFGCGDGGWTPVMKIDGNKNTFHYDSGYWSDKNEYNILGGVTGFDTQETKLPTYWKTPFTKICLGMKIGQQLKFIVINKQADSLYSLIADGQYRKTSLGRKTWKTLIGSQASLQLKCNKEGFNTKAGSSIHSKARIGFICNQENDCSTCDSRIGFGTGGRPDNSSTCGNEAYHNPDNNVKHIRAMGYILVQ